MKHKRNNKLNLILLTLLISLTLACSSFRLERNTKMTDEQYYAYLRKDTLICELPEVKIKEHFCRILDTVIIAKEKFTNCNEDLNPYVYSIRESYENDTVNYYIEKLYSTLNFVNHHTGAFEYKGEIFIVSSELGQKSAFYSETDNHTIEILFCDRIHHPKYNYILKVHGEKIHAECIKNEIITIQ
jgi:hypothetical protein